MNVVKLKKITLANFKSLNLSVDFNDDTTTIKGRNGIGKSSIQAAWNWLLSSYTNANVNKNHELFDNREELTEETPKAVVTVVIETNGNEYTLEKSAEAKFTRPRGKDYYIKASSDVYSYKIDNIETPAKAFSEWIEVNICPNDMITYCLDGTFFANLCENDKNKARKVLEQIIGEIKESDFKGDYSVLSNDLKRYTIEQILERTKAQIKPLEERSDKIPSIIEDKEKSLAEYEKIDFDAIADDIKQKENDINNIDNQILGRAESIKPILGERDKIFEIINGKTVTLNERRNAYNNQKRSIINKYKNAIEDVERTNAENLRINERAKSEFDTVCKSIANYTKRIEGLEKRRESLLAERDEIKSRVFNVQTCAYCGQELPPAAQDEARLKFNAQKTVDLESVVTEGKSVRNEINNLKQIIAELEETKEKGYRLIPMQSEDEVKNKLKEYESNFVVFEDTDEYKKLAEEIDKIKETLPEIPQNDNNALTDAKKAIMDELTELNRQYGLLNKKNQLVGEIVGLKAEIKVLATNKAKLEGIEAKCKEWIEERANIISNRINDKMTDCQIVMFSKQKNGEEVPDCIITDMNGVKYSTLNNSNRIKTCISLQQLFCRYYDVAMPVFIDEASVFDKYNLPNLDSQTIYLFASDDNFLNIQ